MHPNLIALQNHLHPSPLTQVKSSWLRAHKVELWLKRDDLIHPIISGNKWRKLKYILAHALAQNSHTLISMGGAWSNHLHALAYVGQLLNLHTRAFVRGEAPAQLSPTLQDIMRWNMQLTFTIRHDYQLLRNYKHWQALPGWQTGQYWLPEGGALPLALAGVQEMTNEIDIPYDYLCVACGTGTTLAGIIANQRAEKQVIGFSALKDGAFLSADVQQMLTEYRHAINWHINSDYHFGGFAKTNAVLQQFMHEFMQETQIVLDPVYTGKMCFGIYDLIRQGYFQAGDRIIAVHTGGLQGSRPLS